MGIENEFSPEIQGSEVAGGGDIDATDDKEANQVLPQENIDVPAETQAPQEPRYLSEETAESAKEKPRSAGGSSNSQSSESKGGHQELLSDIKRAADELDFINPR